MWQELTPALLKSRLTATEAKNLQSAVGIEADNVLQTIAKEVASEWRGALARFTALDTRPEAVPSELLIHILADFRYRAYTRFPGIEQWLGERRVEEWRRANYVRDNLGKVQIAPPEPPHAPGAAAQSLPLPAFAVAENHLLD